MDLPICAHCQIVPVKRPGKRYCSRACYHASRRRPPKQCRCGVMICRQATQCRACVAVTHRQQLATCRAQALEVSRMRTIARRRARFSQPQKKSALWNQAYRTGFSACWQSFQRKIQRGDLIVVRERRVRSWEAA